MPLHFVMLKKEIKQYFKKFDITHLKIFSPHIIKLHVSEKQNERMHIIVIYTFLIINDTTH